MKFSFFRFGLVCRLLIYKAKKGRFACNAFSRPTLGPAIKTGQNPLQGKSGRLTAFCNYLPFFACFLLQLRARYAMRRPSRFLLQFAARFDSLRRLQLKRSYMTGC